MGNDDNLACSNHFGISISCTVWAHTLHHVSPSNGGQELSNRGGHQDLVGKQVEGTGMKFDDATLILMSSPSKVKNFPSKSGSGPVSACSQW
jgi:hypothetical protein